jgi:succinate-semialdehyde dehydrogenase/glutarate-semialdehyde dehydrogenase
MRLINPATEEVIRDVPQHDEAEVERRLRRAEEAFRNWRTTPMAERRRLMHGAARVLRERIGEFARGMTTEMGKPVVAAEQEVEKCATCCDYFADHAEEMLSPREVGSDAQKSYIRFDPIGAVLAIMPWNFPFWQVIRFAAPALMAGNVGVLKHAPNVPGCALALERVFVEAGFPEGAFTPLLLPNERAEAVIRHPVIRAVTLTGSGRAGRAVAAAAGSELKKTVLELGGSDPFVVLRDADVEAVAREAAKARCINSGQSCIAAKRFIVEEPVADQFERAMTGAMAAMRVGDPTDRATEVGPLARLDLLENLDRQVRESVAAGAKVLTGGKRLDRKGYYYPPTVLAGVRPGMPAFDEETFGPVAAVIRAADAGDALRLANTSNYGLGASLWTNDIARAEALAADVEAGCVFVNGIVKSDPRLPFGGIKQSGHGRELSAFGIHEFVNVKTVWVGR